MWRFFAPGPVMTRDWGLVTALPASPNDGDTCTLVDSLSAPTFSWELRYVAAKSSNKWVCVGGSPWFGSANPGAVFNTLTQVAATGYYYTAGMYLAVPVAGDYNVSGTLQIGANGGAAGNWIVGVFGGSSILLSLGQELSATTLNPSGSIGPARASATAGQNLGLCGLPVAAATNKMFQSYLGILPAAVGG